MNEKTICYFCGKEIDSLLPFRCSYCNLTFCSEHRLPENHNCTKLPKRSWKIYTNEGVPEELKTDPFRSPKTPFKLAKRERIVTHKKYYYKISSIFKKTIKLLGFIIFTVITALPCVFNGVCLVFPEEVARGLPLTGLLYIFSPDKLLFYIAPILIYLVFWLFVVFKILKRRCKLRYHLILLGISFVNWWNFIMILRTLAIIDFFV